MIYGSPVIMLYILNLNSCSWCFCSVTQLCPTPCHPINCSTPGFPVLYYLPEFAQIHVHWVGDAIQSSHPLLSPSPPAYNLFQNQGLFQWLGSLEPSIRWPKYWSFSFSISPLMNFQGRFPLELIVLVSLQSKGLSRVFPSTTIQKH